MTAPNREEEASRHDSSSEIFLAPFVSRVRDLERAKSNLAGIWQSGAPDDLLQILGDRLGTELPRLNDLDSAIENLNRFVSSSRSPTSLLALFERDPGALPALLQVFATSQLLADRLIADPESFDLLRASDGQPAARRYLVDELASELKHFDQPARAAGAIRKFAQREILRIAYGEFIRDISPDKVGRQLSYVWEAAIECALQFSLKHLAETREVPLRLDNNTPQVTVIGLSSLGGEELSYASPLKLMFFYDSIDQKNASHVSFYATLVEEVCRLLQIDDLTPLIRSIDLSESPRFAEGVTICSVDDAVHTFESSGETWQRLSMVKARVVAGSQELGKLLLKRLERWVYRRFLNRADLADIRTLRHKLERRAEQSVSQSEDVVADPGGRRDVELTVQFMQLLHGSDLPDVRVPNTMDAMFALERAGCITKQEAILLSGNYARLCRLEHQLSVMSETTPVTRTLTALPDDETSRRNIAWRLGIRSDDGTDGDHDRFMLQLRETFKVNRKIINHLMIDAPHEADSVPDVTELMLDPQPAPELVEKILRRYGFTNPEIAMDDLVALSTESTPYLSPQRCRHFFALIAPTLLAEVERTPDGHATLAKLVSVTDSIGAKSMLWELFGSNRPTMQLMVRLCAATPYLTDILIRNPGMIDELVDSLLTNCLPSTQRLDAQSIELCRGAEDIEPILYSFKNAAHLTIGVRDILGKETVESTHQALSDTAEACVRRVIEFQRESLANRFGDPMKSSGDEAEMIAVALGKFGGREPNYHSDLDVVFLYDADGETRRRVGGHRSTTTNHHFFNQLAQEVTSRINKPGLFGQLYELDSRLRMTGEEGLLAISIDDFLKRFRQGTASLWQRLSLCKSRSISGSRRLRQKVDAAIIDVILSTKWRPSMAGEIRTLRGRMQQSATVGNLKRGEGGLVDIEMIAQALTLKYASESPEILATGTTASLALLASAGYLSEEVSLSLIANYRTLRWVEANLRLMNTPARHDLPEDVESMRNLAFLMNEQDEKMILARCRHACHSNRKIFDSIFDELAQSE